ncbi:MAG TPA: hypothetical protein VMJ10_33395 [Kofleriaceae bacterium]|nr:hypothetical protein [Kofleriaceae bacterium]
MNLRDTPAIAYFSVAGEAFSLANGASLTLPSSSAMGASDWENLDKNSPQVLFRPSRTGVQDGTLTISVQWTLDGAVESHNVALHGRARELTQAPSHEVTNEEKAEEAEHAKDVAKEEAKEDKLAAQDAKRPPVYNPAFDGASFSAAELAGNDAAALATAQKRGVSLVEREVAAYKKPVPRAERSVWWTLLKIALNSTTAGLAGEVVEHIGELEGFAKETLKAGLEEAGKEAIEATGKSEGGEQGEKGESKPDSEGFGHSTNHQIDFFGEQQAILDQQAIENQKVIAKQAQRLRPLLRTNPERAIEILKRLSTAFKAAGHSAEQRQASNTAAEWTAFVARAGLGSETVESAQLGDEKKVATRTEALRETHGLGTKPKDGVLDIYLGVDEKVMAAKLFGVGQSVADRFGKSAPGERPVPLSQLATMPIRIVIGQNDADPTIITRDEAGRVRVHGRLNRTENEPDEIAYATALVERILASPLQVEVQSDDTSSRI